ncbi:MAG: formate dehydrogenase subunit gamma [Rhodobacteraceae bacterium]|nr:formate dehydrogenase subunit gamma [Paracoccaceae bacterium]
MPAIPSEERVRDIIADHMALEGPLLPIFHALQAEYGHVPQLAVPVIAEVLNLGRAEVHGVLSFYHDFREAPAGKHVVKICRAEACQSVGSDAISERAMKLLGVDWHGTTKSGNVTLEPVFCLGLCACGPAAMVDGKLVGRVDAAKIDRILAEVGA